MPDTTTQEWKVDDKALIDTWGPDGPTGRRFEAIIFKIAHGRSGPYYHLRCCGIEIVRSARELKRPTPTEPATCHNISRLVGIHIRIGPPKFLFVEAEESETILTTWANDFCDLLRYVRGGDLAGPGPKHAITIVRDEQDQCSACGKDWKPRAIFRGARCPDCHTLIDETEPTP